jgi:uncharacterized protein YndB with AHSA1/START domain
MSEFTVTRTLKTPRERVWQVLTQPNHFEGWPLASLGIGRNRHDWPRRHAHDDDPTVPGRTVTPFRN